MRQEIHEFSDALEGVVADLAPSLVSVLSHRSRISGFIWRAGRVVTSDEGLADEGDIHIVLPGGETVPAQLTGRDPTTAIAVLQIDRPSLQPVATAAKLPGVGALVLRSELKAGRPRRHSDWLPPAPARGSRYVAARSTPASS